MLGVGARVRLRLDHGCRRQHAWDANGRVGTIVAVVTDDVLTLADADPRHLGMRLSLESFDGHLYSVELSEPGELAIELCAASELEALPR